MRSNLCCIPLIFIANGDVLSFIVPNASLKRYVSTVQMSEKDDAELYRQSKWLRQADINDRVVELKRPLGLVLNQDDSGNVYVETVAAKGNAARTGQVKEGDLVVMCSATFGEQMWSTRGVGLYRVMNAIRVRAGPTVRLVFENPKASKKRAVMSTQAAKSAAEARQRAQRKKDNLMVELKKDEKKLKKKFLGLF